MSTVQRKLKGSSSRPDFWQMDICNLGPHLVMLPKFLWCFTWFSAVSVGNVHDTNKHVMNRGAKIPVLICE